MRSKVAVVRCEDYNQEKVRQAVKKGIDLLGGISGLINPGEKILLKPNLLVGDNPLRGTNTHPLLLQSVGEVFKTGGANLFYGDSPGIGKPERAARRAGYARVAEELDMQLADFQTGVTVSFPEALLAKQMYLAAGALEADGIISISKMKTHGFTRITGAVKNQFGCIPGFRKSEYHVKMPDVYDFSKVCVDINRYLKPRLYIMDGIAAMEGNGPRGGELVNMKVLLFSTDPVALDAICCRLIDLDPEFVPTARIGKEGGLGTYKSDEIRIVGADIEELINKNFQVVRRPPERLTRSRYFPKFLKNHISPRPVINDERCVNCGQCVLQCPVNPKAVNWPQGDKSHNPVYNYKQCIRCYCCQEICPEKAISIKVPILGRLIYR
ncbi:MAG: DUF362 domain-containing protein [Candidatus Aminicenantes bacterium]|jgi:uncharacterized protein (DUF362 family)/Pyruvate/2-oxoacid:ferredoxin oxidoreductase delta subunit